MKNSTRTLLPHFIMALLFFFSIQGAAQNDTSSQDLNTMSLQDLLKVKIATNKEQVLEEAPSIVSVIGKKDIAAYGCRELSDVLRLVPGFEYGADLLGLVGLRFRGIWTQEGKALLMLNGVALNDLGYGSYNYVGTLPVSIIDRVEIIRGPGSALYGAFAEVCVINIITVPASNTNNIVFTANGGLVGNKGYAFDGNLTATGTNGELKYNINIGYAERPISTRDYHDFFGNSLRMDNKNGFRKWHHIMTELSYKGLTVNFHRTLHDYNGRNGFYMITDTYLGKSQDVYNQSSNAASLKYDAKIGSKFSVTPQIEYIAGNSGSAAYSPLSVTGIYNLNGKQNMYRVRGQIAGRYNFGKAGELTVGAGYSRDIVKNSSATGTPGLSSPEGDTVFSLYTESKYVLFQYMAKVNSFGFIAGSRYESTSFGEAIAPRAGITFFKNQFNFKLLYGKAYRIPLPWQAYSRVITFYPENKLEPELTGTAEFEVGYKVNNNIRAKVNAFIIDIDKPISYLSSNNSYHNFGKIQSLGMEAELAAQYRKSKAFLNFSYNKPGKKTSAPFVTADGEHFLAMPAFKINVGGFKEFGKLTVGPTFTWLSESFGESQDHALGLTTGFDNTRYNPVLLTNLNIVYKGLLRKLTLNLSAYNLFDQKYLLVQPYYGAHAPLPANDRQITLGARLDL